MKPVEAADGHRVPLLRPGFRPPDSYTVSFVLLHAGAPFGKKGGADLALPRMDIPVGLLEWEVFLPKQYKVADFGGDALLSRLFPAADRVEENAAPFTQLGRDEKDGLVVQPGEIGGVVVDAAGAVIPHAVVQVEHLATRVTRNASSDGNGRWVVSGVPSGKVRVTISRAGFQSAVRVFDYDDIRGTPLSLALQVGSVASTVEVTGEAVMLRETQQAEKQSRQNAGPADAAPSSNVTDLQRRVVGVLPIAVNVPRTGNSYSFVRPLVVGEETRLTFTYRSR